MFEMIMVVIAIIAAIVFLVALTVSVIFIARTMRAAFAPRTILSDESTPNATTTPRRALFENQQQYRNRLLIMGIQENADLIEERSQRMNKNTPEMQRLINNLRSL